MYHLPDACNSRVCNLFSCVCLKEGAGAHVKYPWPMGQGSSRVAFGNKDPCALAWGTGVTSLVSSAPK